ncbi:PepSY domain-containing protein [Psychrobium sp. MM17-31]|uniref:PepSY-associated TM helix domain-containing protein n=1 Tax=Psychrobium sp. MM17-31 TaxID=2917758 RepID=UPI001EF4CE98|nr:PepSY-associated TM helix domain-containing protein [Psychrobium sp. MM17-31]MCG7531075.1 PepSY domain-containing protein [Psychrobium sp. MM17-31]
MSIRKILFWFHLIIGCSAAIFIFLMSITGGLLTYERQMINAGKRADYPVVAADAKHLSMAQVKDIASAYPVERSLSIILSNEHNAPIMLRDGRKTLAYLHPVTGEKLVEPGKESTLFWRKVRAFHRWLTLDGKFSTNGRWVNGVSNAIFVLLALTGIYLWLPKRFNRRAFKKQLTLPGNYTSTKARDYQWHNVFGIYLTPVLVVLAATALFFSFKWPGDGLKQIVSTQPVKELAKPVALAPEQSTQLVSLDSQLSMLKDTYPEWQTIRFSVAAEPQNVSIFSVDNGNGGEPKKRFSVAVDNLTGVIADTSGFDDYSTYRKIRNWVRFAHTGEYYGIVGQTIAGVASFMACLLVYTGVMLSWRRWKNRKK